MCFLVFVLDVNAMIHLHIERLFDIYLWIGKDKVDLAGLPAKDKRAKKEVTAYEPGDDR